MYKIKEFSTFAKVSTRMLRYYDQIGLLRPAQIDEVSNYRLYSSAQIPKLLLITKYRDLGFSTSEISQLLEADDLKVATLLNEKISEITENISTEMERITILNHMISSIEKERTVMEHNIIIKSVPEFKVLSIRSVVKSYKDEVQLWEKLGQYAMKNCIEPAGAPFAIYHDGEYKEENVDIEVAMPVNNLGENESDVAYRIVGAEESIASIIHEGDYTNIDDAFYYLARWIEENGYSIVGNVRQVSLKGAWNEEDPNKYLVEIQMPVCKNKQS